MTSIVTLLGFDIEHVLASILRYKSHSPVREIYAIVATISGTSDRRALAAFSAVNLMGTMLGVRVEKVEVEVTDLATTVRRLRNLLAELASSRGTVVLDIGGGPRLLLLEATLAYLSLDPRLSEKVRLVAYLERTGELKEISHEEITAMITGRVKPLTKLEEQVLALMSPNREYRLRELHSMLLERDAHVSKQYVEKVLKSLVEKGFLYRKARGVYVKALDLPTKP